MLRGEDVDDAPAEEAQEGDEEHVQSDREDARSKSNHKKKEKKDQKKSKSGRKPPSEDPEESDEEDEEDTMGHLDPAIAMALGMTKKKNLSSRDTPSGKKDKKSKDKETGKPKPKMKLGRHARTPQRREKGYRKGQRKRTKGRKRSPSDDSSSSSSSSSSTSSEERRKRKERKKKKGCDDFELGKLPGPGEIITWTDKVRYKITAANKGDPDETVKVHRTLERAAKSEDPCPQCPIKFQKMDIKLALALNKIATG
eukprot:4735419-Amphidinium_carterae.1